MWRVLVLMSCALTAIALTAIARADTSDHGVLLETTYALPAPLFLRGGESTVSEQARLLPYTFAASIALRVSLTHSLEALRARDGFAHAFTFIPRVDLRHGADSSFPIRTPSYYPTLRFQGFYQWRHGARSHQRAVLELLLAHLSNGQDGCLYRDQVEVDGRCVFEGARSRRLNHRDGSFASNELGLRAGIDLRARSLPSSFSALFGVVLFRPYSGGADPEIREAYGIGRVELWLRAAHQLAFLDSQLGARARIDARFGGPRVQRPWGATLDAFWRFAALDGWGPFLRLRAGSDDYNVRFDARVLMLGLGLMWEA